MVFHNITIGNLKYYRYTPMSFENKGITKSKGMYCVRIDGKIVSKYLNYDEAIYAYNHIHDVYRYTEEQYTFRNMDFKAIMSKSTNVLFVNGYKVFDLIVGKYIYPCSVYNNGVLITANAYNIFIYNMDEDDL